MLRVTLHSVHPGIWTWFTPFRALSPPRACCFNRAQALLRLTKQLLSYVTGEKPSIHSAKVLKNKDGPSEFSWNRRILRRLCSRWIPNRMPPVCIVHYYVTVFKLSLLWPLCKNNICWWLSVAFPALSDQTAAITSSTVYLYSTDK